MPSDVTADRRCRPEDRIMQGVIPYLAPRRTAGEAADFYMRAFGAQDIGRMPFEGRPDQTSSSMSSLRSTAARGC